MNELTTKQRFVYNMMLTAKTYEDMESIMQLSKGGVRYYVSVIIRKLGYRNRVELMADYHRPNQDTKDKNAYCSLDLTEVEISIFICIVKGFTLPETSKIVNLKITSVVSKRSRIMKLANVNGAFELICKYYNISDKLRVA
jgi:DNA-binding NarL/FixJ family response regulator